MITTLEEPYGDPHVAIRQIIGKASGFPARLMLPSRIGWLGPLLIIVNNTKTVFGRASYDGQAVMRVGSSSTGASRSVRIPNELGLTEDRDWQNNISVLPEEITVDQMPVLVEN